MKVLFNLGGVDHAHWEAVIGKEIDETIDFYKLENMGDPADIDYVLTWSQPHGFFDQFTNLKGILVLGAGVSHLMADPTIPKHIPIGRLVDETSVGDMAVHALHWVLHFHRDYDSYSQAQAKKLWQRLPVIPPSERTVAVLGLGAIGSVVAEEIARLGFKVLGWSRSKKEIQGVESHTGESGFENVIKSADIFVNILPVTHGTTGIYNAKTFAMMKQGATFINLGRGESVVDGDLVEALNSNHLRAAALDVFPTEPLPQDDPYWEMPNVFVTPHIGAPTNKDSGPRQVGRNLARMHAGDGPLHKVDFDKGY